MLPLPSKQVPPSFASSIHAMWYQARYGSFMLEDEEVQIHHVTKRGCYGLLQKHCESLGDLPSILSFDGNANNLGKARSGHVRPCKAHISRHLRTCSMWVFGVTWPRRSGLMGKWHGKKHIEIIGCLLGAMNQHHIMLELPKVSQSV